MGVPLVDLLQDGDAPSHQEFWGCIGQSDDTAQEVLMKEASGLLTACFMSFRIVNDMISILHVFFVCNVAVTESCGLRLRFSEVKSRCGSGSVLLVLLLHSPHTGHRSTVNHL